MYSHTIQPIPAFNDNYIWAIINPLTKTVYVVDPGNAEPVVTFLIKEQLTLKGILITHHHWDHTNGIADLVKNNEIPVFASATENVVGLTHPLHEHDEVALQHFSFTLKVLAIPGHTLGHIAYYSPGMLFCGDTLFAAGCGRIFEGTAEQMYLSLQKLAALPESTHIYCGHEYTLNNLRFAQVVEPSNIAIQNRIEKITALRQQHLPSLPATMLEEKATNPFLRCNQVEVINQVEIFAKQSLHSEVEVFAWLRKWKDGFK